ncbi:heavy-metal-associated domain-containing protein [bacterium]|nr:heavy-metal-associated domain-containing protein [bacterium]
MKHKIILTTCLLFLGATQALAETIEVGVNGMVCSFCSQGLTKTFSDMPQVSKVEVSLEKKNMHLEIKDGQTLSDEQIKKYVTDAGYEVDSIARTTKAAPNSK